MVRVTEASPVAASPATGPQKQSVRVPVLRDPTDCRAWSSLRKLLKPALQGSA